MVLICSNIFIYLPNINVVFDGLGIISFESLLDNYQGRICF